MVIIQENKNLKNSKVKVNKKKIAFLCLKIM